MAKFIPTTLSVTLLALVLIAVQGCASSPDADDVESVGGAEDDQGVGTSEAEIRAACDTVRCLDGHRCKLQKGRATCVPDMRK